MLLNYVYHSTYIRQQTDYLPYTCEDVYHTVLAGTQYLPRAICLHLIDLTNNLYVKLVLTAWLNRSCWIATNMLHYLTKLGTEPMQRLLALLLLMLLSWWTPIQLCLMPRQLEAQVCRINQAPPDNKEVLELKDRGGPLWIKCLSTSIPYTYPKNLILL